jgi:hypothetical protein
VGGGLGWFCHLYHKNINKTLILQNSCDDFCWELPIGDGVRKEDWQIQSYAKIFRIVLFLRKVANIPQSRQED